jgi:hypothetical protein
LFIFIPVNELPGKCAKIAKNNGGEKHPNKPDEGSPM